MNYYLPDDYDCHDWDYYGYPSWVVLGEDEYIPEEYMDELWKPIVGFENEYWVSNYARVWSVKKEQFLKIKPLDARGHLGVCLYSDGERYYRYIHRLVAEAFIPHRNDQPIVRHICDDPNRNEWYELAWGTRSDNARDAIRNGKAYMITPEDREKGLQKIRKPIVAIDLYTGENFYFRGQHEAAKKLGIQQANIWKVLNGERRQAAGYRFKYANAEGEYGYDY